MIKSLHYAYVHRRERKGDMRRLWIQRVNAAARSHDMKYSQFINGLIQAGVIINRKILAEMAISDPEAFARLVSIAREQNQN
ncbi:50S ribosomal protein L20, partial [Chloroflexota bacterium]